MATLTLEIVTPEERTYSGEVNSVVLPGIEGELGIFPNHVPLMTQLAPGELRLNKDGEETVLAVGGGFVEITGERVSVLTDMAVKEDDIDLDAAEAAMRRAQEALADDKIGGEDHAVVMATLQKSLAQIKVKRRRRA